MVTWVPRDLPVLEREVRVRVGVPGDRRGPAGLSESTWFCVATVSTIWAVRRPGWPLVSIERLGASENRCLVTGTPAQACSHVAPLWAWTRLYNIQSPFAP